MSKEVTKKILVIFMAFILLFCSIGVQAHSYAKEIAFENEGAFNVSDYDKKYRPDDKVTIFVMLEEQFPATKSIYLRSKALSCQSVILDKIGKICDDDFEINYQYTRIMNAFSIDAKYDTLSKIKNIKGVKSAFVAPTFKPCLAESINMMHTPFMWKSGYDGSGRVVAIVDTGIVVDHNAFTTYPEITKLTKEKINALANSGELIANGSGIYKNAKIPFGYNYANGNTVVSHGGAGDHGTHVAGIAAGNSNAIKGVAPEAQIVVMNVFDDSGSAGFDVIAAALEDCAALGVDSVNLSLGAQNGFTEVSFFEAMNKAFENLRLIGISVASAAGNESTIAENNRWNGKMPLAYPDLGTVDMPATTISTTAVASYDNDRESQKEYFTISSSEKQVRYYDSAPDNMKLNTLVGKTLDVVHITGLGDMSDYDGIDVSGKIVLVSRGGLTFEEKMLNAYENGAVACVIFNNSTLDSYITIENYVIPTVLISYEDGYEMTFMKKIEITVNEKKGSFDFNPSSFSSWGCTPDLKLKPEVSAPGGSIYSATGSGYGYKSGTSMATPHIAGAMAIMRQYIEDKNLVGNKADICENILMSTAFVMRDNNGVPYSPRQQGSGSADFENALKAGAYATVNGSKPKIELYDDVEKVGKYKLEFEVNNYSDSDKNYAILVDTITHGVDGEYISLLMNRLSPEIEGDKEITVKAHSTKKVSILITLSASDREYLEQFENGMFVEGFINLFEDDGTSLTVPFMGFYGDWSDQPIFDKTMFDEDWSSYGYGISYPMTNYGNEQVMIGNHPDDANSFETIDKDKCVISPNGDGMYDGVTVIHDMMLRNLRYYTVTITDENGGTVFEYTDEYYTKPYMENYLKGFEYSDVKIDWFGRNMDGKMLENGSTVTVTVRGDIDYDKHELSGKANSWSFPVLIDLERPNIEAINIVPDEDGRSILEVSVSDNHYMAGYEVYSGSDVPVYAKSFKDTEKGETVSASIDVTDFIDKDGLVVKFYDYAYNVTEAYIDDSVDVNKDGVVNTRDAVKILEFIAELDKPDEISFQRADLDKNGKIEPVDCVELLHVLAYGEKINHESEKDDMSKISLNINGTSFEAELENNETAKAFYDMLPMSVQMNELNGNEKYVYLDNSLPSKAQRVGRIEAGDIMLYGNNCIVIFYESFNTSYSYTKIGKISNVQGLKAALGSGNAYVSFNKN